MKKDTPNQESGFDLANLEYELPQELIAQQPAPTREDARLLVVDRESTLLADRKVPDLVDHLKAGDLLILNNTKVIPAKFSARRRTGGAMSGLFIETAERGLWRVMLTGSRRLHKGETIDLEGPDGETIPLTLMEICEPGQWLARAGSPESPELILERIGKAPLPPYIKRGETPPISPDEDRRRYQTAFARVPGAVAAPTAGLHLTENLIDRLHERGIETAFVTLHVGIGTFKPISADRIEEHVMHTERYLLSHTTADAISQCRQRGGRVVAVGTTSVRVLESTASGDNRRMVIPGEGTTGIFIYPPYKFKVADALLTNFHLPKSTLLALVMSFAGIEKTMAAYQHAIEQRYRFFSYGDAMLIE